MLNSEDLREIFGVILIGQN